MTDYDPLDEPSIVPGGNKPKRTVHTHRCRYVKSTETLREPGRQILRPATEQELELLADCTDCTGTLDSPDGGDHSYYEALKRAAEETT